MANGNGERKNNIMKLNSLVDFLEDKEEEWTERQPRRFLDRNSGRGRRKIQRSRWCLTLALGMTATSAFDSFLLD
jgi:hypothetical protein